MSKNLIPVRRALVSVTDKSGLARLITGLKEAVPSLEVIASGGTARALEQEGLSYTPLDAFTGFPECFGGRVKTLHPLIAGGILMRRDVDEDEARRMGILPIDLVVCNLYNFAVAAAKKPAIRDLTEEMDIGGSTLIRSGCKNYFDVATLVDPADYDAFLQEVKQQKGSVSFSTRRRLAVKGINLSADYESLLAGVLTKKLADEETRRPALSKGKQLRYGENPDQEAWVFSFKEQPGIAKAAVLSGKELSFNNYEDATVAYNAAQALLQLNAKCGVAIVKHGSLCAYAAAGSLAKAFALAWEGDSKSAYGSVIAATSCVDDTMIPRIKNKFIEALIAPGFSSDFLAWAREEKPRLRLLELPNSCRNPWHYKNISGGMLVQTTKERLIPPNFEELFCKARDEDGKRVGVVTKRAPRKGKAGLFAFGIAAVNFAKSNAVAIVREPEPGTYQLIGMGAGQPNRVDSLQRLAVPKAIENLRKEHNFDPKHPVKTELEKCVLASDGFFPFDDSIRYAASTGLANCIQPGGSIRDKEVIAAADELDVCLVFTGERYFYH